MDDDIQARLVALAARDPAAVVLRAPGREPLAAGALAAQIAEVRGRFADWGLARGDVVAAAVPDRPATCGLIASAPVACTLAPLPAPIGGDACRELLERMRARAVIVPHDAGDDAPLARAARERGIARIGLRPLHVAGRFALELLDAGRGIDAAPPRHPPTWAYVAVTSGTTGRPKLVPATHASLLRGAGAAGDRMAIGPGDVSAIATPLHLANGHRAAFLTPLGRGAGALCLPDGDVNALFAALLHGEVTFVSASFTIMRALLERAGPDARVRSPRLRFLRIASGALDPAEILALERVFGVPAIAGLSTTECGMVTHQGLPPEPRRAGGLGRPLVDLRIVGDDGREVAAGTGGEVQVRADGVFCGYLDDEALEARVRDGAWVRLGDLARFDADGELTLLGRLQEVLNRGGEKISLAAVDVALLALPGVADGAGFALPHATLGEEVGAAIAVGDATAFRSDEALERLRARLGPRHAPKRLWVVDRLPRNAAGKVLRGELASRFAAAPDEAGEAAPADPLDAAVTALWASVFGRDAWPPGATFESLGGGEREARALAAAAQALFGVEIEASEPRGACATPAAMARRLAAAARRDGEAGAA